VPPQNPTTSTSWSSNEATTSSSLTRETPSKPQSARFKNAVVPNVLATRDFASVLDSGRYDHLQAQSRRHVLYGRRALRGPLCADDQRGIRKRSTSSDGGVVAGYGRSLPATTASGRARLYLFRRTDASRVQRAHEDNRPRANDARLPRVSTTTARTWACRKLILLLWRLRTRQRPVRNCAPQHFGELGRRPVPSELADVQSA